MYKKICKKCNKIFLNKRKNVEHCSRKCSKIGHLVTEETKKKIGSNFKGVFTLSLKNCQKCSKQFRPKNRYTRFCSKSCARKGHTVSNELRLKISKSRTGCVGYWRNKKRPNLSDDKSHFWKGGLTNTHSKIRNSLEYRLWRKSVFERDNYTCVWCNKKGVELQADHIKPFSLFPELRFAIDNGRTLCKECHKTTDTYMGKIKNYKIKL